MKLHVRIMGCDDTTEFDIDGVSDSDKAFLQRLVDLAETTSTYGCMPTMEFSEAKTAE